MRVRRRLASSLSLVVAIVAVTSTLTPRAHAQAAAPASAPKLTKPPKLVTFVDAPYPEEEKSKGRTAVVVLRLTISASGTVDDAAVTESAGGAFDAAAIAAARRFVFEPAEIDGKPSPIKILYKYEFTLKAETPTTAVFDGVVRDRASQKALANVTLTIDTGATATTDAEGRFHFDGVAPGKHVVTLAGEALTAVRTEETFEAGKRLEASYDVQKADPAAEAADGDDLEIVVTAPALDKHVVATEVSADEGKRLPGTQGDVLKVIESMPGVARSQVGSGQLVVWGAAPDDTRVYVDGVRLPRLYHGGGLRSVVATELVDTVSLAPGGYGAAYGRGLGGLVTVRTKRLGEDSIHAGAAVDLLDAAANVRVPLGKGVRIAIAGRRSHLHSAVEPFTNEAEESFFAIPRYYDGQARASFELGPHERFDVTGMLSGDRVERNVANVDPILAKRDVRDSSFQRIYARYERETERGAISVVPWVGFDSNRVANRFGDVPAELLTKTTSYGLRASWRGKAADFLAVTVGVDAEVNDVRVAQSGSLVNPPREGDVRVFGQIPRDRVNGGGFKVLSAGLAPYGELDLALFQGRVHVIPGLRFDPYVVSVSRKTPVEGETPSIGSFRENAALEPRLAVEWAVTDRLDLRTAYGRYHQSPTPSDLSAVFGNPLLPTAAADHALVSSGVKIFPKTKLEATAFHTWQSDLAMRNPASSPLLAEALLPIGAGRSYGVQMLLRQSLASGISGWISYAIVKSERRDAEGLDYRPSDFDQAHVLTALASWDLGKGFEVGARVRFATGLPRTPVLRALYDSRRDIYEPVFGAKNSDRIPSFFQADVRASKRFALPARSELEVYLEVQNVTNRANPEEIVYSSSYADRGYITGLPILPVLGARWSL